MVTTMMMVMVVVRIIITRTIKIGFMSWRRERGCFFLGGGRVDVWVFFRQIVRFPGLKGVLAKKQWVNLYPIWVFYVTRRQGFFLCFWRIQGFWVFLGGV